MVENSFQLQYNEPHPHRVFVGAGDGDPKRIKVLFGDPIYYGGKEVGPDSNDGRIAAGKSERFDSPVYLVTTGGDYLTSTVEVHAPGPVRETEV